MNRKILITKRNIDKAEGFAVTIPIKDKPFDIMFHCAARMNPDAIYTDLADGYADMHDFAASVDIPFYLIKGGL